MRIYSRHWSAPGNRDLEKASCVEFSVEQMKAVSFDGCQPLLAVTDRLLASIVFSLLSLMPFCLSASYGIPTYSNYLCTKSKDAMLLYLDTFAAGPARCGSISLRSLASYQELDLRAGERRTPEFGKRIPSRAYPSWINDGTLIAECCHY